MDRAIVKSMVEDLWRAMIPAMQQQDFAACNDHGLRFEKRVAEIASGYGPLEKGAFLQAVDAERELMISAYKSDPAALKRRLGIPLGVDTSSNSQSYSSRQTIGEMAVRTAVRATIWETVWSLFRLGR